MALLWLLQALLLAFAALFLLSMARLHSSTIPTPRRKPTTWLLGTLLDGTLVDVGLRHRFYASQQLLLGPIFRVVGFFGRTTALFVTEPPDWYRKADSDRSSFRAVVPHSLLGLPMGEMWATHRKLVAPLFSTSSIDSFLPVVHAKSVELCQLWREQGEGGVEVDVHKSLSSWSLDIFGRVACAHDFEALACDREQRDNPYAEGAKTILHELVRRFLLGVFAPLQRRRIRAFRAAVRTYTSAAHAILRRAEEGVQEAQGSLAAKLAALSAHDGSRLSRAEVADEVTGLLIAGHETSSNTAAWALHLLSRHPQAQEEVRAEVARLDLRDVKLAELYGCCLLQGVMYEALRLYPTVPLAPRLTPEGTTFAGHKLPARRPLLMNKVALCNDPALFPNPAAFDPSRFSRGEYGAHGAKIAAFGSGPRMCVGYRLAEAEVLCLLAHVLRHFRVAPGGTPPVERYTVTVQPANGLFLRLTPLQGATDCPPPREPRVLSALRACLGQ
ncbi:hypothetical protein AB1Y20_008138 [Prymnesium parvum]|uniref:Cytochrome P450 n=1 Tax=Prymnesium parvum TaxID=97485 RepID=A0AB34ITI8_PRYPA